MVEMISQNSTSYIIRVYSLGYYIGRLGVQGLLLDSSLVNKNYHKTVIQLVDYHYTGGSGITDQIILQIPGILFPFTNIFFSLYHFTTIDDLYLNFFINASGIATLKKNFNQKYIGEYMLVFYRNICNDPFYYN